MERLKRPEVNVNLQSNRERGLPKLLVGLQHVLWRLSGRFTFNTLTLLSKCLGRRMIALASVGAIIERNDALLLIERMDGQGYSLPGGLVRQGETLEEALVREVREETGYEVIPILHFDLRSGPDRDERLPSVAANYLAEVVGGTLKHSAEGFASWQPIASLPTTMAFDHREVITRYLANAR